MIQGFPDDDWIAAQQGAVDLMVKAARRRGMITYSDLFAHLSRISMQPHDPRVHPFLEEIAVAEDAEGRGMLTVVVVHKTGDMEPGKGFYELAKRLGRNATDLQKCWIAELHKVHAYWAAH